MGIHFIFLNYDLPILPSTLSPSMVHAHRLTNGIHSKDSSLWVTISGPDFMSYDLVLAASSALLLFAAEPKVEGLGRQVQCSLKEHNQG